MRKYETHKGSPTNFKRFLTACKKAVNKLYGYEVAIDFDFWSCIERNRIGDETNWEILTQKGKLTINNNEIAIDFEFGRVIYADQIKPLR